LVCFTIDIFINGAIIVLSLQINQFSPEVFMGIYSFEIECMEDMDYRAELGFMGADDRVEFETGEDDGEEGVTSFTGESEDDEIDHSREDAGMDWETSEDPSGWDDDNRGGMDFEW
jgi:hypothetical protein